MMEAANIPVPTAAFSIRFRSRAQRRVKDRLFVGLCIFAASVSMLALVMLLTSIISQAFGLTFDSVLPALLLGILVFTTGASSIAVPVMLPRLVRRKASRRDRIIIVIAAVALIVSIALLVWLWQMRTGRTWLTWQFIVSVPSRFPELTGIWPAMIGTVMTAAVCALTAVPVGVATAVLLEEFRPRHRILRKAHGFVQLNITNLAGVPSIVYGILGLTAFVQVFGAFGTPNDPAFTLGVKWYDQFYTESGEALVVPVADQAAPSTSPRDVTEWRTESGEVAQVRIVERESAAAEIEAADAAVEAFEESMEERMGSLASFDAAGLAAAVEEAWVEAGLTADATGVQGEVVELLLAAGEATGREARRALRQAVDVVERAEMHARFPGVLFADASPSRTAETKPWYFRLPLGRGVLAGGLTLMLVVLPIVIIASQEALRAVPRSMRAASLALGATPWQTVRRTTLPAALPGIMTGVILAMSRAIGEAAPILVIAGIVYITFIPHHLMDDFTVMPLQIYNWASQPQEDFHFVAAAGIILLMAILLCFNATAILIRQKTQKQFS